MQGVLTCTHPEYGNIDIGFNFLLKEYYQVFYIDIINQKNGPILNEEDYLIPVVINKNGEVQSIDVLFNELNQAQMTELYVLDLTIDGVEKEFLIIEFLIEIILEAIMSEDGLSLNYGDGKTIYLDNHLLQEIVSKQENNDKSVVLVYDEQKDGSLELFGLLQEPSIEKGGQIKVIGL